MPKLQSRRFILCQTAYNVLVITNIQAKLQWIYSYEIIWNSVTLTLLWISASVSAPWQVACCYSINCAAFWVDYRVIFSLLFRGKLVESHRHRGETEKRCPGRPGFSQGSYSFINTQNHSRSYFHILKIVG